MGSWCIDYNADLQIGRARTAQSKSPLWMKVSAVRGDALSPHEGVATARNIALWLDIRASPFYIRSLITCQAPRRNLPLRVSIQSFEMIETLNLEFFSCAITSCVSLNAENKMWMTFWMTIYEHTEDRKVNGSFKRTVFPAVEVK